MKNAESPIDGKGARSATTGHARIQGTALTKRTNTSG